MKPITFTATDGKVFSDRSEYRRHEMLTQYTYANRNGETLTKPPGSLQGQPFDISDCKDSTLILLDNTDQVQMDECQNCRIFIAGSSESLFIRNCSNCTVAVACKQLRTRDCTNCTFYLHSKTEPIIETSSGLRFAPFNGAYKGHENALLNAGLLKDYSLWYAVFDFNDSAKTGMNWSLLKESEEDGLWTPLNDGAINCCKRITPGSIPLPSLGADPNDFVAGSSAVAPTQVTAGSGGMQSFTFDTSLADAAAITGDAFTAQESQAGKKAPVPKSAEKAKSKSKIGWNPNPNPSPDSSPAVPEVAVAKTKTKVGWNPGAFAEPAAAPVAPVAKSKVGWNPSAAAAPPSPPTSEVALAQISKPPSTSSPPAETIFSMIVSGKIPCTKVYEDTKILAFHDIAPQAPVHIVIIPKDPAGLSQLSTSDESHVSLLGHLMYHAGRIGKEMCGGGFRVVVNDGVDAAQSVYHLHYHVIGGRGLAWPPG